MRVASRETNKMHEENSNKDSDEKKVARRKQWEQRREKEAIRAMRKSKLAQRQKKATTINGQQKKITIRCNEKNSEKLEWQIQRTKLHFYSSE